MKTKEQLNEQIETFLNKLDFPFCLGNHIIIEEIELESPFYSILNQLEDNNVFEYEAETIYYYSAMDYLKENDPSLKNSLNIAFEFGYLANDLDSEILATLLKAQKYREQFYKLEDEIRQFFNDIQEDILSVSE
jgi:hypothetical protein